MLTYILEGRADTDAMKRTNETTACQWLVVRNDGPGARLPSRVTVAERERVTLRTDYCHSHLPSSPAFSESSLFSPP
jgi:hypothetical protein